MISSQLRQEVLELLSDLIQIPSTASRPDEINRCADFICNWLDRHNISHQRIQHGSIPSILALPKPGKIKVLLMTHFDVVEVDNSAMFTARKENGRLYGRGSIDDKYGVALSLILYREHLASLKQMGTAPEELCFGLLLTGDEESGGRNGAGMVANDLELDFFLALDGGRPEHIVTKEKGILALKIEATGKAAHAARPWLGQSAFDILIEDYRKLQQLFAKKTDNHWHKTMVLANCHAGNGSSNIVPEKAEATLDIRYTENDNPDQLLKDIQKIATSKITLVDKAEVFASKPSPYLDLLVKHTKNPSVGFEHGASDARYLSGRNIPGAIWGADGEMSQHTENEYVVIDSIFNVYSGLDGFLKEIQQQVNT